MLQGNDAVSCLFSSRFTAIGIPVVQHYFKYNKRCISYLFIKCLFNQVFVRDFLRPEYGFTAVFFFYCVRIYTLLNLLC